jgi:hypothetical protein
MTLRTLRGGSVYNGMKHAVVAALLLAVAFAVALMRSPKGTTHSFARLRNSHVTSRTAPSIRLGHQLFRLAPCKERVQMLVEPARKR